MTVSHVKVELTLHLDGVTGLEQNGCVDRHRDDALLLGSQQAVGLFTIHHPVGYVSIAQFQRSLRQRVVLSVMVCNQRTAKHVVNAEELVRCLCLTKVQGDVLGNQVAHLLLQVVDAWHLDGSLVLAFAATAAEHRHHVVIFRKL